MDAIGTICKSIQADNNNADSVDIKTKSTFYARAAGASAKDQPKVNSNFRTLVADLVFDGVNISIPRKVVEKVSTRFEHTLYGYFIGKRMAFPVVEYYARNNWAKHGLKRIMMNSKEADPVYVVTIGIPSLSGDGFTKETICVDPPIVTASNVVTPTVEKTNDGFQTVGIKKKRKGKSKSTNDGQFVGPSVKQNVRYELVEN
ncbi:hypothetical protein Tco_1305848 [Tanacetum coccineum]